MKNPGGKTESKNFAKSHKVSLLIVLPSYNEAENIVLLIKRIFEILPSAFVCIVDDNSPDGTAQKVRDKLLSSKDFQNRVHLIVRSQKSGRGGAVRAGFEWGLKASQNFSVFAEMDCDFSHDPEHLPRALEQILEGADFTVGSRYPDGEVLGWPLSRKILSFFSNVLARLMISFDFHDYTGGYRLYNRKAVEFLCQQKQHHVGYIYLSEMLSALILAGFRGTTFPIVFKNRERGISNTNFQEVWNSLKGIFLIGFSHKTKALKKNFQKQEVHSQAISHDSKS